MKIGFTKKRQGMFDQNRINQIIQLLKNNDAEVIQNVDYRDMTVVNNQVFINNEPIINLDAYFWHDTIDATLWQADNYYLHALDVLNESCRVINTAQSTRIVNDKFLSHRALRAAGISVAEAALVRANDISGLQTAFEKLGNQVLLKPRFGGWGSGIVRVNTFDELRSVVEFAGSFLSDNGHQIFLEKFYENDPMQWVSIVVINNEPIFGYRKGGDLIHDWKVYDPDKKDGRGSQTTFVPIDDELRQLGKRAAQAIGRDIIGFDCILTRNGYVVVDENGRPGLYQHCLEEAGIDLNNIIVQLILDRALNSKRIAS